MTIPARDTLLQPLSDKGLCPTCRCRDSCMYAGARDVWQCELFDDGRDNRRAIELASEPHVEPVADSHPSWGLCGNCDERATCTLRSARGGVWHCEEYR